VPAGRCVGLTDFMDVIVTPPAGRLGSGVVVTLGAAVNSFGTGLANLESRLRTGMMFAVS